MKIQSTTEQRSVSVYILTLHGPFVNSASGQVEFQITFPHGPVEMLQLVKTMVIKINDGTCVICAS